MEEYLITARSVTQAQRMAQLLERRGVRAVVGRVPMGLTGKGGGKETVKWRSARGKRPCMREAGFAPAQVFVRQDDVYSEVEL